MNKARTFVVTVMVVCLAITSVLPILAQTRIKAPNNPYSLEKDIELGRQASTEAEHKLPLINDRQIDSYVEKVGRRLVNAIPAEFQHPEFQFSFKVVNAKDINAFALPGGFTYVNRGLIEVAHNEGELAGVMAHEISHVALRHGTAQAAKAQKYAVGAAAGQILGAIIGGGIGQGVSNISRTGVGLYFLKFSREYEMQADILGAQIMANAGYDPHDLANVFRTLEQSGGKAGPQILSDHPNPGNRYEYINREASLLKVNSNTPNGRDFTNVQARLNNLGPVPKEAASSNETASNDSSNRGDNSSRGNSGGGRNSRGSNNADTPPLSDRVEFPSLNYRDYEGKGLFRLSVPDNWRDLPSNSEVTFAPEGAYGELQNRFIFTRGLQIGVTQSQSRSLRTATDEFIRQLVESNPSLKQQGAYQRSSISGKQSLVANFTNVSDVSGQTEIVSIYTVLLPNGDLLYAIPVAPQTEYRRYQRTFQKVINSIELSN